MFSILALEIDSEGDISRNKTVSGICLKPCTKFPPNNTFSASPVFFSLKNLSPRRQFLTIIENMILLGGPGNSSDK